MGQILPDSAILIKGIGIVDFLTILLIVKYFQVYKTIKSPILSSKFHKTAIYLSFFFLIIYTGTFFIKHYYYYGLGGSSFIRLNIRLLKLFASFVVVYLIIIRSTDPRIFRIIKKGLTFGFLLYGIMVFFSTLLITYTSLNLSFETDVITENRNYWETRNVGIFSGTAASLSQLLAIGIGFFLAVYERNKKKTNILFVMILITSIIFIGTRAAMITVAVIFIFFVKKNARGRIVSIITIIALVSIIFVTVGSFMIERLGLIGEEIQSEDTNRRKFQLYYIKEIISTPHYLVFGYTKASSLYKWRVPHNAYLNMIFWGGIVYLFIFLRLLYKIYKVNKLQCKSKTSISILYPFIGFVIPYLFASNIFVLYFPLILAVSYNYFNPPSRFASADEKVVV